MIVSAMLESPSPKGRVPHQEGVFAAARQYGRPRHPPLSDETGGFELPGPFLPSNNTVESGSKGPRNPRPRALAHTDPRELKHRNLGTSRHSQHHRTPKDRHRLNLEHTSQYFFLLPVRSPLRFTDVSGAQPLGSSLRMPSRHWRRESSTTAAPAPSGAAPWCLLATMCLFLHACGIARVAHVHG
jgi:hypothetical protein